MRYLALTILIIGLIGLDVYSQTLFHQRLVVSSGGGLSSDGTLENLIVVAQSTYGKSNDGTFQNSGGFLGWADSMLTSVDDANEEVPYRFELSQNYPNPFNPVTSIEYNLPRRSQVSIEIYNVLGQRVRTLVDREESAGSYTVTWNGTDASGHSVATGVYLYRFQAGDHIETKKMLLLK